VQAIFTTRHFGFSNPPYDKGNLAFHVGDNPETVMKNHEFLAKELGYELEKLVFMKQIHSDLSEIVDQSYTFYTPPECDALITNIPDIPLMVMSADCTPILIFDSERNVIAAVHAGRAGALEDILPKTIKKMQTGFGTNIEDLKISLGPSIHGCCYEINQDIAEKVENKGYKNALRHQDKKVFLDVNTILLIQLSKFSIDPSNIEVIDACTSCHSDTYFSYRAHHQRTGRIAGVIRLHS